MLEVKGEELVKDFWGIGTDEAGLQVHYLERDEGEWQTLCQEGKHWKMWVNETQGTQIGDNHDPGESDLGLKNRAQQVTYLRGHQEHRPEKTMGWQALSREDRHGEMLGIGTLGKQGVDNQEAGQSDPEPKMHRVDKLRGRETDEVAFQERQLEKTDS